MQVSCCGKKFCEACIDQAISKKKACPQCQAKRSTFQIFEDKGHRQAILELAIYCENKRLGCSWIGELCHQDFHLNLDPTEGSESKGCQYVEHVCIHCSKPHPRYHMLSCLLQRYTCPCCKHYSASYNDVTNHHMLECEEFPVQCSLCGWKVAWRHLQLHSTECALKQEPLLDSSVLLLSTVQSPSHIFIPPPSFVTTNFTHYNTTGEKWFSPPFYSHIGGYKMSMRVDANGQAIGAWMYISVFFGLMKGEYDNHLLWPFRGAITCRLVNHRANDGHVDFTVNFDDKVPGSIAGRVTKMDDQALYVLGYANFILHSSLCYNELWNTEYLNNDSLEFQVTNVETAMKFSISAPDPQPSNDLVQPDQPQVQPVTIVMSGFITTIIVRFLWFSQPFYSHNMGYKMCIRVCANGEGSGAETHTLVFVHLMQGKYDDSLPWPFRGTITLQLVNQDTDEGHVEHTIDFDNTVPDYIVGRVMNGKRAPLGLGCECFVPHSVLCNKSKGSAYLMKDSLVFRITQVKLFSLQ